MLNLGSRNVQAFVECVSGMRFPVRDLFLLIFRCFLGLRTCAFRTRVVRPKGTHLSTHGIFASDSQPEPLQDAVPVSWSGRGTLEAASVAART